MIGNETDIMLLYHFHCFAVGAWIFFLLFFFSRASDGIGKIWSPLKNLGVFFISEIWVKLSPGRGNLFQTSGNVLPIARSELVCRNKQNLKVNFLVLTTAKQSWVIFKRDWEYLGKRNKTQRWKKKKKSLVNETEERPRESTIVIQK